MNSGTFSKVKKRESVSLQLSTLYASYIRMCTQKWGPMMIQQRRQDRTAITSLLLSYGLHIVFNLVDSHMQMDKLLKI